MQLLATADLMRGIDRAAIETLRIPGLVLMENAGRAFTDELERSAGALAGKHVVVICGRGNNGGDGFVIARHAANRGAHVVALLLGRRSAVTGDARTNLDAARGIALRRGSRLKFAEVTSRRGMARGGSPDIIVDAIFGTGFSGPATGVALDAITWINSRDAFVASVDIPSGVDASTGEVAGSAVSANLTVAMGLAKVGHFVGEGCDRSGAVRLADIGVPPLLLRPGSRAVFRVEAADAAATLPPPSRTAHKYSAGKVLVVAGSRSFTGAPLMTAAAALRSGAGAVVLAIPSSIHRALARRLTEVILLPLPETPAGALGAAALEQIGARAAWADSIAIGPGMSREEETLALVREILTQVDRPVVVDADALVALKGQVTLLRKRRAATILTPHTGEFASLTGTDAAAAERRRVGAALEAAGDLRSIVVLKGAPTVTALPGGPAWVNSTGNPGMATIGSGDVLTGLIAGILAQGSSAGAAAYAGVYIHGLAGDIASARLGMRSVLATDIGDSIAAAVQQTSALRALIFRR